MNHPTSSDRRNSSGVRTVLLLILLVAAVVALFWYVKGKPQANGRRVPVLAAADVARLVAQKNVAVGQLENEKLPEAQAAFNELAQQLPSEPLPIRNLAICHYLLFDKGGIDAATLSDTLNALEKVEPNAPSTFWLQAKALLKRRDQATTPGEREQYLQQALGALEHAMQIAPDNPIFWFEAFDAVRYADDPETQAKGSDFLARAYALAPGNLFVLVDRLVDQATRKDAEITKTLEQAKEILAPLAEGIRRRANSDVMQLISKAMDGVEKSQWPVVLTSVRGVMPLVRSEEISRSDFRRIAVNPLEYVLYDFSPPFYETNTPPEAARGPEVKVAFEPISSDALPELDESVREVQFVDFDLDNRADLFVLGERTLRVYVKENNDSPWRMATSLEVPAETEHFLVADLDRDTIPSAGTLSANSAATGTGNCYEADGDLVTFGKGGIAVFRNQAAAEDRPRRFEPVEQSDGLEQIKDILCGTLIDFDHDGDLDLVVSSAAGLSLWGNRENLTFANFSSWTALPPAEVQITSMLAVDWDQDVDTDLLMTTAEGQGIGWLENLRHGQMRWRTLTVAGGAGRKIAAVALLDANGDASWELALAGAEGLALASTTQPRPADPAKVTATKIQPPPGDLVQAWDYDNDGQLDLLFRTDHQWQVLHGAGNGAFQPEKLLPESFRSTTNIRTVDFDTDGDLDILGIADGKLTGLTNQGGNQNHWLSVRIRGEAEEKSGRVNHWGIGSLLELKSEGTYQARVVTQETTQFGLGAATQVDVLRVLWTNGVPQSVIQPAPDRAICEKMTLKGSCPYLYTWTGERFEFFTDLLWAAPIGLQLADGQLAPSRPWEYLLIPGERLQSRQDQYELRITEELWEAGYFDQVSLQAVDHPADVEVYSNEKVGPAEIAEFKMHTVRERKSPVAARDQRERDVLPAIAKRDGVYLRAFDRTFRQGLAEPHFVELDLGKLDHPRQITLFLTGWIYPTDTSLNIAISQNPELEGPRPPSIQVPDAEGKWQEVVPYMGFPGGKTKTIAVDLSHLFAAGDYRLRIVTSAELYWDEIFFTVNESAAEVRVTPFHLLAADLDYRGFSEAYPRQENSPETYDYSRVARAPKWPPMGGAFTRYGDVRELLVARDNQLVVMSAGDEIALRFGGIAPPPEGWKRDFVIYNAGWDKDADMHTVYGQSSEPLPFSEMKSYPYAPLQDFPTNPNIQRYFRTYQTRYQHAPAFWKYIRNYTPNN